MDVGADVGSGTDVAVARAAAGVSAAGAVVAASQAARMTIAPRLNSAILARAVRRGAYRVILAQILIIIFSPALPEYGVVFKSGLPVKSVREH